jgi:hypothetical protein
VKDPLRHIEEFVKQRLSFLETPASDDWLAFEKKLKRALFFRRLKIYTSLSVVTILFFLINQNFIIGPGLQDGRFLSPWNNTNSPRFEAKPAQLNTTASPVLLNADELNSTSKTSPFHQTLALQKPAVSTSRQAPTSKSVVIPNAQPLIPNLNPRAVHYARTKNLRVANNFKPKSAFSQIASASLNQNQSLILDDQFLQRRTPGYNKSFRESPKSSPYVSPLQQKNTWSYSLNVYPNFTFRKFRVNPDKVQLLHSDFIDEMQNNENRGFSLNVGFEVSKRIGLLTYLNSGLEYITNTYQADFNFTKFRESNLDPLTGEILNYNLNRRPEQVVFSDDNQFHYLNLPLSISYQPWATKHLRLNLEGGASMLYFLNANGTTLDYSTLDVVDLAGRSYRKLMGSLSMKIGLQYWVNPQVNIGFEPTFMYFTNTIYTNGHPFDVIPYSLGLNFNLQVKLN